MTVLLAEYEITARKLLDRLQAGAARQEIDQRAGELLRAGEQLSEWARFRLAQCADYLEKTLALKTQLAKITKEAIERDYHHDGALPPAPPACYHVKDAFVHPATVLVLTRDEPALGDATRTAIAAEIREVLGHLEAVRQLIVY